MTIDVRSVIQFFYLLDTPDADILALGETAHGEGTVNLQSVQRQASKFRNGTTDLDDEPKPGRPQRSEKFLVMRTMIEENSYLSQKKIA
jgi:hypothetical protein